MPNQITRTDQILRTGPGSVRRFGVLPNGWSVDLVTLSRGGTTVNIMTWGASLQDFRYAGVGHSMVLGCEQFGAYLAALRYFGAIVGPVANRIANGRFQIEGAWFDLDRNEANATTLHGGENGVGQQNWELSGYNADSCRLVCRHADGTDGFPGNLDIEVTYSLDDEGALSLDIAAITDAPTYCNLAHHSYWNLDGTSDLRGHELMVNASRYLPVDDKLIPNAGPAAVADSPFDFTKMRPVVEDATFFVDHNFCLDGDPGRMRTACLLRAGGYQLDVATTEPGLQVYDGVGIASAGWTGHSGSAYGARAGIALEPQNWPDAPNRADFPPALLQPGETYRQQSRFSVTTL